MHQWAEVVEALSEVLGENYKQDGESVVQDWARLLSRRYAGREGVPRLATRMRPGSPTWQLTFRLCSHRELRSNRDD